MKRIGVGKGLVIGGVNWSVKAKNKEKKANTRARERATAKATARTTMVVRNDKGCGNSRGG
jgi:hypothetical protein